MFNKAINIDKNYSLAYAGLGRRTRFATGQRNYANKFDPGLLENSYVQQKALK